MSLYITPDEVMVGRQIAGVWGKDHGVERLYCLECPWSTVRAKVWTVSYFGEKRSDAEARLTRHVRREHPGPWERFARRLGFDS